MMMVMMMVMVMMGGGDRLKLLKSCRVDDINLRDLLFPEPAKTRKCLSALINYSAFTHDYQKAFEAKIAESVTIDTTSRCFDVGQVLWTH